MGHQDIETLERFLDTTPERQEPRNILPIDELKERLALIDELEKYWYDEFPTLTGKPDRTEYKPFNNLQIAALMIMSLEKLRNLVNVGPELIMTCLCNTPYLVKMCKSTSL